MKAPEIRRISPDWSDPYRLNDFDGEFYELHPTTTESVFLVCLDGAWRLWTKDQGYTSVSTATAETYLIDPTILRMELTL